MGQDGQKLWKSCKSVWIYFGQPTTLFSFGLQNSRREEFSDQRPELKQEEQSFIITCDFCEFLSRLGVVMFIVLVTTTDILEEQKDFSFRIINQRFPTKLNISESSQKYISFISLLRKEIFHCKFSIFIPFIFTFLNKCLIIFNMIY